MTTLVTCPNLNNLPVAMTWTFGGASSVAAGTYTYPGRVLHYVSHLEQQKKTRSTREEKKGKYNLQMIFVNFVLMKQDEYNKWQEAENEKKKPKKKPKKDGDK